MDIKSSEQLIKDNLIVKHYAGSHAYGTNIETSDVDFRGIFVANPVNIRTPFFPIREAKDVSEEDTTIYELSNYMKLALDCNPNVLESLWVDASDITVTTPEYELLRSYAPDFLSSKIAFTTSGYATAQLKRLTQSKKKANYLPDLNELCAVLQRGLRNDIIDKDFIFRECGEHVLEYMHEHKYIEHQGNNILKTLDELLTYCSVVDHNKQRMRVVCKPQQKDFVSLVQWFGNDKTLRNHFKIADFKEHHRLIPYGKNTYGIYPANRYELYDFVGNLNTTYDESIRTDLGTPLCIIKLNVDEFNRMNDEYHKFWEWRKNRNSIRLGMEEQFGLDLKHAMHLVRLLRIGEEVLTTGQYLVKRPDAAELLDIRAGKWKYDELIKYADEKDRYVREVLYHKTVLPKTPNLKLAAKVIMDVQDMQWSKGRE